MRDKLRGLWFWLTIASGICLMVYNVIGIRYFNKNSIGLSIGAVAVILYIVNCVMFSIKVRKS